MNVLVIGGTGQLARHLRVALPRAEFWDRKVVDLADRLALEAKLVSANPTAIVNAAAYTAVDRAESEPDLAWRVNAEAPAALARAAQRLDIPLVHVSTDYVFDGSKQGPYLETDAVRPINEYGRSKLGGELAVSSLSPKHWILRTSWVFSEHGQNFPKTMLRLARDRLELRVVDDQLGRPTYAGDLASCIANLLAESSSGPAIPWGLHHVGGGEVVSWCGFAETILARAASRGLIARQPKLVGIATTDYPTPAARPRNSVLQTQDSFARHTRDLFDWSRGLDQMLGASA